jgi:hypothetical protein
MIWLEIALIIYCIVGFLWVLAAIVPVIHMERDIRRMEKDIRRREKTEDDHHG